MKKYAGKFPILGREVYGKPLVYLDSGATAQKPLAVIEMVDYLQRGLNANIHRGVHYLSEEATTLYEAARERIGAFIGAAEKEEVVFTAGATASLNTVAYAWVKVRPCGRQYPCQRDGAPLQYRALADARRTQGGGNPRPALRRRGAPVHRTAAVAAG